MKTIEDAKELICNIFPNIIINTIEVLGSGNDSVAYLINNEYVFKIKFSNNDKKGYEKEKAIYDFLNSNMNTSVKIPNIEYSYITEEISILGYKQIKGKFLSPNLYRTLTNEEQQILKEDISTFLSQIHSLDTTSIAEYTIDNKQNIIEKYELLKSTIYDSLTNIEKQYIDEFMTILDNTNIFNGRKCLCHNDFSCNHILLDDNNRLYGIIDFGDSGITDEYTDFIYLLEDSEEEIGKTFGIDIINLCGDIDLSLALLYQEISEQYYPIELIVYGIKNNNKEFIIRGREEINNRMNNQKKGIII